MKTNKQLRHAIAMIELIFAIVVMGIALLSAPMILGMSIQSANISMQQESIAATASELSLIMTHAWDESDSNTTTRFGILDVASGHADLNNSNRLSGGIYQRVYNTAPYKLASATATFGQNDVVDFNDIDDFDGRTSSVTLYSSEVSSLANNEGEYLKGVNFGLTTAVNYINDTAAYVASPVIFNPPFTTSAASTNIKQITVTLAPTGNASLAEEHNQSIVLRAFVCNIGNAAITPVTMN